MKGMILTVLMFLSFGICHAEEIVVEFATGEWEPYTSEKLPEHGAASELVSAVCKAAEIKPAYEFYPWKRAERMTEDGKVFAAFPYAVTEERKEKFDFSDTLFHVVTSFFYHIKNPKTLMPVRYEKIGDMRKYKIGVVLGFYFEKELADAGITYEATPKTGHSVRKLATGRIDFYLDEQVSAYYAIKKLYPNEVDNFRSLPKAYGDKIPIALLVSRKYPKAGDILKKFNDGLAIMKENGEYDRIADKHHMAK